MPIRDYYKLKSSNIFNIKAFEEVRIDLELKKEAICNKSLLVGKVLHHCKPVNKATVKVLDINLNPLFHTSTNSNGIYTFENVLSPGEYKVIASSDKYVTSETKNIFIKEKSVLKVNFNLEKNKILRHGLIYGTVKDSYNNQLMPNVKIILSDITCNKISAITYSNDLGEYLIYNLVPGKYIIRIMHQNYLPIKSNSIDLNKCNKSQLDLFLIKKPKDLNSTISGKIEYNNNFISNVPVFLYKKTGFDNYEIINVQMTNDLGNYLFPTVFQGEYVVKAKLQIDKKYIEIICNKETI